jgi:hypothetical protein
MARFGLLDAVGHFVNVIAFASVWDKSVRRAVHPGAFVKALLEKQEDATGRVSYLLHSKLVLYKKSELER